MIALQIQEKMVTRSLWRNSHFDADIKVVSRNCENKITKSQNLKGKQVVKFSSSLELS